MHSADDRSDLRALQNGDAEGDTCGKLQGFSGATGGQPATLSVARNIKTYADPALEFPLNNAAYNKSICLSIYLHCLNNQNKTIKK